MYICICLSIYNICIAFAKKKQIKTRDIDNQKKKKTMLVCLTESKNIYIHCLVCNYIVIIIDYSNALREMLKRYEINYQ